MLMGTSIHAAIHHHFEQTISAETPPTIDDLMTAYRTAWSREGKGVPLQFPQNQTAQTMESTARRMLECFQASPFARLNGKVIGIEESFRVHMDRELPDLSGRVDMIALEDGELVVTDFKTARGSWSEDTADDRADQLIFYAQGCKPIADDLGVCVRLRFVVLTKTKEPKIESFTVEASPDRIARTKTTIRQVFRAMQAGAIYPVPSPMNCSGCAFQKRCKDWHRTPGPPP